MVRSQGLLIDPYQSGFRPDQGIETALVVALVEDPKWDIDKASVTLLVLLHF